MFLISEIKSVTRASVFQRCRTINEKHGVLNVVFLAELGIERVSESVGSRRLMLYVA